jgi:hypothetical protein
MALEVRLRRTELGLGDLVLNSGAYRWDTSASNPPAMTWERAQAGSRWVDGDYLTGRRKGLVLQPARVVVIGTNNPTLRTAVDALIDAVSQFSFGLYIHPDNSDPGVASWEWSCQTADYGVGVERLERNSLLTDVILSIPRLPDPIAGQLI